MKAENSWQSNSIATRFTLMELSRHSDHYLRACMFYLALIPPFWFRVVDPIIAQRRWEKK